MAENNTTRERGDILVTALIVMAVGVLLVLPVLHFVSTRHSSTRRVETTMGSQYAQDAGIEHALWKIETDEAFRQELIANPGQVFTLTLSGPVNNVTPIVEVVRLQPALWTYSIWVSDTLTISGNNTEVYGDIHSNGSIYDQKTTTTIHGGVTYVDSCAGTAAFSHAQQVPAQEIPAPFRIEDFRPGGTWAEKAAAEGKYFTYASTAGLPSTWYLTPGLYYFTGDVTFTNTNVVIQGLTVVTEGTISINQTANKVTFDDPYVPGLLFFSNSTSSKAVYIDGNKEAVFDGGLIYAPRGTIEIAGNSLTTAGWFLAKDMVVSKNGLTINPAVESPGGGLDLGLSEPIFDIRASTPGGSRTVVRLEQQGADLNIVAWDVR